VKPDGIKKMFAPSKVYGASSTSVSKAFAAAIAAADTYDEGRVRRMLELLDQNPDEPLLCTYCAAPATSWDHLESIVRQQRYNPPGHVLGNLVPCCSRCNSQKGNQSWRDFVAKTLPPTRQPAVVARIERVVSEFRDGGAETQALNPELIAELMTMRDEVHAILRRADEMIKTARPPVHRGRARPVSDETQATASDLDRFFDMVFDRLEPTDFKPPRVRGKSWRQFASGPFGSFWVWPTRHEIRVVCYLATAHKDAGDRALFNQELFALLLSEEEEIESIVGEHLLWDAAEGRQACWIGLVHAPIDFSDAEQASAAADWSADATRRLMTALADRARAHASELLAARGARAD
jgi:hypothetical protein